MKNVKKVLVTVLSFALIITGICLGKSGSGKVKAAAVTDYGSYAVLEFPDVDCTGELPTPKQEYTKYKGWLFAGWFYGEACTLDNALKADQVPGAGCYAKFVPADVLSVKAQIATEKEADESSVIRFVSSVESLDYAQVGFEVTYENKKDGKVYKKRNTTKTVFERIDSTTESVKYEFSPKVVDTKSEYMITAKLPVAAGDEETLYTVRAFWKTLDGKTVYGAERCVAVTDGRSDTVLNMTFASSAAVNVKDTLTVTYGTDGTENDATAEVIGVSQDTAPMSVHVRIKDVDKMALPSATKFVFKQGDAEIGSGIHRNLYTSYSGEGTADTTWYEVYREEDEFVIATNADMYGFAKLVNDGNWFADKKVYMVSDIALNKGSATESGWDTTHDASGQAITDGTSYEWPSIGNKDGKEFKGNFDAQGHEITGLLDNVLEGGYQGLFGVANTSSSIKNLYLTNSYIVANNANGTGSIAGRSDGTVDTIYSDSVILGVGPIGGIVGKHQPNQTDTHQFKNLNYDGIIKINANTTYCGGILGQARKGSLTIVDCLFSGNISASEANGTGYFGGILGGVYRVTKSNDYVSVTIERNLNSGVLKISEDIDVKSVAHFGYLLKGTTDTGTSKFEIQDSYYTNEGAWGDAWYEGTTSSQTGKTSTGAFEVSESEITGLASHYNQILVNADAWVPTAKTPELKAFAQAPMSVEEPDNINLDWYPGIADEYTICSADDSSEVKSAKLRGFAYLVNVGVSFKDKTVKLGADVTLNQGAPTLKADWETYITENTEQWIPIGSNDYGYVFAGTFDGGYDGGIYSIKGIYIDSNEQGVGFFKSTADGSTIQNLKIENSYFKTSSERVGSVVGSCGGNLNNVYSNAVVVSSTSYSGGLIGQIWNTGLGRAKTISKCWYDGEMSVQDNAGGLIGLIANGKITMQNCLYTGNLEYDTSGSGSNKRIGGLCGRTFLTSGEWGETTEVTRSIAVTMECCLNIGYIQGGTHERIGSIIGEKGGGTLTFSNVYATKESYCYNKPEQETEQETEHPLAGYGVKEESLAKIKQYTEAELKVSGSVSAADVQSKLTGFDFNNTWTIGTDGKPGLKSFTEPIEVAWYYGDGVINTRAELLGLSYLSQTQSINKNITLGADIDLNPGWTASETSGRPDNVWSPVGNEQNPFAGTFDGNGHTISGIYVDDAIEYMGFFGVTDDSSEIKNFRIVNSYFNEQATEVDGYVGSVAGELRGSMTNVYSNAIVKSNNVQMAGMVARVNANTSAVNITDCWFDGTVTGGETGRYLGGIVSMIVSGTCNLENVLFTGVIDANYNGGEPVTIGGIVADAMSDTEKLVFESIISAGKIIGNHNHRAVHSIFGNVRTGFKDNGTTFATAQMPKVELSNVFASRTCYPTAYNHASAQTCNLIDENGETVQITSEVTVTGQVMFTTGDDRLLGYIPQKMHLKGTDKDKDVISALGFYEKGKWSLRKDGVPIPTALTDVVDTEITDVDYSSEQEEKYQNLEGYLTKQIRLDFFGGSIEDLVPYGAGNYLVSYSGKDITKTKYTDYLARISANNRKFAKYADTSTSEMEQDGVYSTVYYRKDIEWVLNITYVENLSTVYISINTDVNSISSNLKPVTASGTNPISFSMLEMQNSEKNGNSFVFQLPNGHFIVNDGGKNEDAEYLLNYMKTLAGTSDGVQNPVYIDAWIVTHYHGDHSGAMTALALGENVYIEAVYACEPSMYGLTAQGNVSGNVNAALKGITKFTKRDGTRPDFYQLHMGQRFYFNGITMDVIDTQEQNLSEKWEDEGSPDKFNSTSTSCIYTFADANGTTQRVIIGGDGTNANMTYIMKAFGDGNNKSNTLSNINIYVAYHHGLNTTCKRKEGKDDEGYKYLRVGTKDWADFLLNNIEDKRFDIVLFPCKEVQSASRGVIDNGTKWYLINGSYAYSYNIGEINRYIIEHADRHYTYGYGDMLNYDASNPHGTIRMTFNTELQVEVYQQGKY